MLHISYKTGMNMEQKKIGYNYSKHVKRERTWIVGRPTTCTYYVSRKY